LEADRELVPAQHGGDLFGTPLLHQQGLDPRVLPWRMVRTATALPKSSVPTLLRLAPTVVAALGAQSQVALDLAVDRAPVATEDFGDLDNAAPGLAEL